MVGQGQGAFAKKCARERDMVEPPPDNELVVTTTRAKPPALNPIPAVVPGVAGGDVVRVDAAVTRSQKRKRDEEEALVVRMT